MHYRGAYEVTWDGVHHGRDEDLLHAARIPRKVYAVPVPKPVVPATERVAAALAGTSGLTMREIVAATGLRMSAVNTAIYGLRARLVRTGDRRRTVYRLIPH